MLRPRGKSEGRLHQQHARLGVPLAGWHWAEQKHCIGCFGWFQQREDAPDCAAVCQKAEPRAWLSSLAICAWVQDWWLHRL
eukprot:6460531-Amphidinium_carterae.1